MLETSVVMYVGNFSTYACNKKKLEISRTRARKKIFARARATRTRANFARSRKKNLARARATRARKCAKSPLWKKTYEGVGCGDLSSSIAPKNCQIT